MESNSSLPKIAVVGISARTAGAANVTELWANVRAGTDSISRWSTSSGSEATGPRTRVGAHGVMNDSDRFDADFFGINPAQARVMDPQHRVFLEESWHALEHAGYQPDQCPGRVGVFASCGASRYWSKHVEQELHTPSSADLLEARLSNDKDFLATRLAYLLNLRGPVLTVQTACSSSLVAIHLAAQSLLTFQADMVVAGGVSLTIPQERGYTREEGSVLSPDGYCRPFDHAANGTVRGDGVGVVVLKRLSDAVRDGDAVHAVICGSAMNNDGHGKIGFTAPSVHGQSQVIREALEASGVGPGSIGYVETHGTATALGDRIELAALRDAFGDSLAPGTCGLGSVKANIGHTDAAAGVLGFIKVVLCVRDGVVPPIAHFSNPGDPSAWEGTPFFAPTRREDWPNPADIRCAGVTSLGMGGTNVHVVVRQPEPARQRSDDSSPHILLVSARSADGLARSCAALATGLDAEPDLPIGAVAATLSRSRSGGPWRHAHVAATASRAAEQLRHAAAERRFGHRDGVVRPVLMFSGQGVPVGPTVRTLATEVPLFREYFDACCAGISARLGRDLADLVARDDAELNSTALEQPALFAMQYAATRWLKDVGVEPVAVVGHSVGEFAAAVASGILTLDDATALIVERGRAMQDAPEGRMVAISLGEADVLPRLPDGCEVAAVNAPFMSVVSGPEGPMADFLAAAQQDGIRASALASRRAFHNRMMAGAAGDFRKALSGVSWGELRTPLSSTVFGKLTESESLADHEYWIRQITEPVRFSAALEGLAPVKPNCWLEIGPGRALQVFAGASDVVGPGDLVAGLGAADDGGVRWRELLAELWQLGADIRWDVVPGTRTGTVQLPGYPFARDRHWIDRRRDRVAEEDQVQSQDNGHQAPTTDLSEELTAIWRDVLGIAEVGPHDDFFEYGHSLAAVRLISRVRERIAPDARLEDFFAEPTFEGLLRHVTSVRQGSVVPEPRVEVAREQVLEPTPPASTPSGHLGLSVIFFSAPVDEVTDDSYDIVLTTAKVADELGFEAVWTPERHFHRFGGAYPNPAVLGAAVAAVTKRVGIRAGSVVLPLHNPIRVAEEWAAVDQLSAGRVAISFAPGWHPIDFALAPNKYKSRYEVLERDMDVVRRLWRGESVAVRTGDGRTEQVQTYPRPAQPELPVWVSVASSAENFARAGRLGANVLTALLSLSVSDLADRIRAYRQAREEVGLDPASGRVTVMAHTFIGNSRDEARRICEAPLKQYILEHSELLRSMGRGLQSVDLKTTSAQDREFVLSRAFAKYFGDRGLMGDADDAVRIMANLVDAGVNEVAALVDFGLTTKQIRESLTRLAAARPALSLSGVRMT